MTDPLALALMAENQDLWQPGTPNYQVAPRDANSIASIAGARLTDKLQGGADALLSALMAPGTALQGGYDQRPVYADGSVGQFDPRMIEDAATLAGSVSLGVMPIARPVNSLGSGGIRRIPSSNSLNTPQAPTVEQLDQYASIQPVPLNMTRSSQNTMDWEKFNRGEYGTPMFEGYVDAPVAVRKRDGEYIIYDGHHRSALAMNEGLEELPMYVIDAEVYDPANAGRAVSPTDFSDIDQLLRDLGM